MHFSRNHCNHCHCNHCKSLANVLIIINKPPDCDRHGRCPRVACDACKFILCLVGDAYKCISVLLVMLIISTEGSLSKIFYPIPFFPSTYIAFGATSVSDGILFIGFVHWCFL